MAYPFLPVNPCCTDVVINDPCGCSSTITNSGCNNNNPCSTHLTASSTIVYDGPALSCTTAEPCDTLNVILQKIDEIICNLLTQINILTVQITNITNQIITINGDIINIYDILDECCGATTTTTSTTTAAPCESFSLDNTGTEAVAIIITDCITGDQEAIVLLPGETNICVETDSPLTVPGTVIVTPNGPCGPTTTTTTTLIPPPTTTTTTTVVYECQCFTFFNSDTSAHVINYKNCDGVNIGPIFIDSNETLQVCAGSGSASDPLVTISVGADCIAGVCPVPTTTTTTTLYECTCYYTGATILQEVLDVTDNGQIILNFNDCDGNPQENIYDTAGFYLLGCVNFIPGIDSTALVDGIIVSLSIGPVTLYEQCCPESPTTSTTTTAIPPTTTTTTTAYVLACTAGYSGPVGFPNRTTGNGTMTLSSGLVISTTYVGPALLTGIQPPYTNCVGGQFGGNVGIGGTIALNYNGGAFTFTITYSAPQTAVKFVLSGIGYADQLGISEYYTITTNAANTLVNVIAGCGDFRVEAPNVVAGSMANPIDNIGGNIEVVADAPFTTITITGNNSASLAGTGWDMYICDAESTTTTTTSSPVCVTYQVTGDAGFVNYTDCNGDPGLFYYSIGLPFLFCALEGTVTADPGTNITLFGVGCDEPTPTTTTTSSSTSTTTSTSSSTTTTTTAYPFACSCLNVSISQIDLDDATGNTIVPGKANNTVYLRASKRSACDGGDIDTDYTIAGDNVFCIDLAVALGNIQLFYYKDDVPIYFPTIDSTYTILYSNCSVSGDCDTTTTTTTVEPTTTTTTTCDPGVSHPYYVQPITTTDTFPTEDLSLSGACSNQACLIASSCSVTGYTFNGYMNSSTPTIGDILYQSNIGCTLSGIADGYYALNFEFGGVYTIIQIVNNTIVSLPLCPA